MKKFMKWASIACIAAGIIAGGIGIFGGGLSNVNFLYGIFGRGLSNLNIDYWTGLFKNIKILYL